MKFATKGNGPKQPTKPINKIIHNGIPYFSVTDSAKYLGTTPQKVREMMGDGSLKWAQFKDNGKLFVTTQSVWDKKQSIETNTPVTATKKPMVTR